MKTILKTSQWFIPLTMSLGMMMVSMGCDDEISANCEGDQAQPVEQFFEDDFNVAICRLQNIEISSGENNLIIRNQDDYEKYVTCNGDLPNIDFDNYFILAGIFSHHQCAVFDNQSVELCENRLIYRVSILEQICFKPILIQYLTVINKKYEKMKIEFDIQLIKNN